MEEKMLEGSATIKVELAYKLSVILLSLPLTFLLLFLFLKIFVTWLNLPGGPTESSRE